MKKLTKEEIKGPDSFLRTLAGGYKILQVYGREVTIGVVMLVVLGLGVLGWQSYHAAIEVKAQEAYYSAEKAYGDLKASYDKAANPSAGQDSKVQDSKKSDESVKKASGNPEQDYATAIASLRELIKQFPNTQAAILAALSLADIFAAAKNWDQATAAMDLVKGGRQAKGLLAGAAAMTMANLQTNKGDCESAIETLSGIVNNKELIYFKEEAQLRQGQCYQKLGNRDKAQELYKQVSSSASQKATGQAARRYLRLLDLNN